LGHESFVLHIVYTKEVKMGHNVVGAPGWIRSLNLQIGSERFFSVELLTHPCYMTSTMLILMILVILGRKKDVMDRGPSHPEYPSAKPGNFR
jgi:hypothetical protein